MSSIVRSIKNVTNGYTSAQVKVRNATSNEPWGPSGYEMDEIAQLTFDDATLFEIMEIIDRRLNDKGKNWRHVLKALVLLDYCIHLGSENCVRWAKDNIYLVTTLREFQYVDETSQDQGMNIRSKAKALTGLLHDDERIRNERANRNHMRDKLREPGNEMFHGGDDGPVQPRSRRERRGTIDDEDDRRRPAHSSRHRHNSGSERRERHSKRDISDNQEDADLQRAIEESKATAREDEIRRSGRMAAANDEDVTYAMRVSQQDSSGQQSKQPTGGDLNLIQFESENESQHPAYLSAMNSGYSNVQYPQNTQQQQQLYTGAPVSQQQMFTGAQNPRQQIYSGAAYQQSQLTGQVPTSMQYQGMTGRQQGMQMQYTGMGYQQPQQDGIMMQQTGVAQPNGHSFAQHLNTDFTGAGFGGYSSQQQVTLPTGGVMNYANQMRSPLSSGYTSPQSGYQSPVGYSPAQTGYQTNMPTGYTAVQRSNMTMEQAMFQQQYQQQTGMLPPQQQQSLEPQSTGRNNPFGR
ncbi:hypothetical protein V1512DRAFT_244967 [Lipomyces arxii]|uniref:uncharacterized protein n=1 Tax=Lipomyces arxii TaxID=56418 RepID=UPI0034CFD4B4